MDKGLPLVSIVMATYNRAKTIERAVDSVLNQTYKNVELIIIDDGSVDNTIEILKRYSTPVIRIYTHETNKGVTAAKNSGLNQIKGEWFTILDSDDEITQDAIEIMIKLPLELDDSITAVTCNCFDTTKNEFSGSGLEKDQYLNMDQLMTVCKGEFWGITKTSLLGNDRFNEKLRGFESVLWYKIDDRARRYYCHKALRIYHTEGEDRIMKSKYNFKKDVILYENLIEENFFFEKIRKYQADEFRYICKKGLVVMRVAGKKNIASKYYELLGTENNSIGIKLCNNYKAFSQLYINFWAFKKSIKNWLPSE
jgi:glycosyltransferase involved in cell wall biosynthesis